MATVLCALFAYRLTGSLLLCAATYLVTFRFLSELATEPGHPQEFALAIAGILCLASFCTTLRRLQIILPCMGALAAVLLLTKINLGVYAILALASVIVSLHPPNRWAPAAWMLMAFAAVAPALIMRAHLDVGSVQRFAALASLTCAAAVAVATFGQQDRRHPATAGRHRLRSDRNHGAGIGGDHARLRHVGRRFLARGGAQPAAFFRRFSLAHDRHAAGSGRRGDFVLGGGGILRALQPTGQRGNTLARGHACGARHGASVVCRRGGFGVVFPCASRWRDLSV